MQDISIESFRGDAEELERMARLAWRDEYGVDSYPNLYKPAYLDSLMQGVDDPRLAIAAYRGQEIVGFLLNLPRNMALDGKVYKAALSCLLVVRKEQGRKGLAQTMIQEGLRRNQELKYDFTLFYLETGHRSSRLFAKLRDAGSPIERVKRMHVIARVLDLEAIKKSENVKSYEVLAMKLLQAHKPPTEKDSGMIREATGDDTDAILPLFNSFKQKVRLARVFDEQELAREIINPPVARTLVLEREGGIKGALSYVIVEHVGKKAAPWAWINHVAWDGLSLRERLMLLNAFLCRAAKEGCAGSIEWSKNVYPKGALYMARFVPYPRQVDMMAWRFRDDISLSGIPEVYEVQI